MTAYHIPVLLQESIEALRLKPEGVYVDATFGGGGHSRAILERLGPKGRLIAFDKDTDALAQAPADKRLILVHNNFRYVHNFVRYHGYPKVDGILADLGVSSHQFDTAGRGFSFRFDGPLDMRMNAGGPDTEGADGTRTAADIVNGYPQEELQRIFSLYGELGEADRLARLIVTARGKGALDTTTALNAAIAPALPPFAEHKYLAKVYQALRIEVNAEMRALEKFLEGATASLKQGGRLVIITYHSLEDRMVKNYIKAGNITGEIGKDWYGNSTAPLLAVNRKPILPAEEEIAANTRARSAKLRIAEKR